MKPTTISEQMLFNTVRLATTSGSGTGFFYTFNVNGQNYPTIITNKHVVNYNPNETVTFHLHLKNDDNSSSENYQVTYTTNWFFHSSKDLCFCFVNPLFEQVKQNTGKEVFFVSTDQNVLATEDKLQELSALEELVMIGYPIGLWDAQNNFPIFRKGFTASHPATDFNEKGIGLVDMACFPGSSGSPIYLLNEHGYSDKHGNHYLGATRLLFIGVLFAGPQYDASGNIVVTTVPAQQAVHTQTPVMINLGYYVKATELDEFKNYIQSNFV